MLKYLLIGLLLFSPIAVNAQQENLTQETGMTPVRIIIYSYGKPGLTYYHPHASEQPSLRIGEKFIAKYGGKIIAIDHHPDTRLVTFRLKGMSYTFDPNRIFTNAGIHRDLVKYGHDSPEAEMILKQFSTQIIALLPKNLIIGIHNNSSRYSINSYLPHHEFAKDEKSIYINPEKSPHNFFYVTSQSAFNYFKQKHFNVLLQNDKNVHDDGSLSVYASQHHIPYVNIEAAYTANTEQAQMFAVLNEWATQQEFITKQVKETS